MRHVQVDMAHLMIHLPDHGDLFGRLQKERRLRRIQEISRNAGRPAARLARIHRLAAEYFVIRFLQFVLCKLRQVGIVEIRHPEGRLLAGIVGHVGMRGIVSDRSRAAGHGVPIGADRDPTGIVRREIGRARVRFRAVLRERGQKQRAVA
jgi:hypothetical protein